MQLGGESRVIHSEQVTYRVLVFGTWEEARDEIILRLRKVSTESQDQIARLENKLLNINTISVTR